MKEKKIECSNIREHSVDRPPLLFYFISVVGARQSGKNLNQLASIEE